MRKTLRERLIEQGTIIPSIDVYRPGERPFMARETAARLRETLILQGLLKPAGWRH